MVVPGTRLVRLGDFSRNAFVLLTMEENAVGFLSFHWGSSRTQRR
jgi:hypothetical protein